MLPLLPLLLPCCSAQRRKAVVALRGDAFRFGHNSKQGCVHVNQSYANQLWQVESIKRYVIEPLRAAGYTVAVTGVVYEGCDAAWTRAIAAALAPASDATRIDFALPRRDEHQQRVVFALAVDHAFRLHPDAAFVVVSRLDVTYCRAMRRPNGTLWRASLGVGVGTGWWDQVHVVGAGARDAVRRVLASPKSLHFGGLQRNFVERVATPTTSPPLFTLFDATPDPYAHCDRPGPPRPGYNFVASTPCCLANSSCGRGRDRCTGKPTVRRHGVKALSSYVPDVSTSSSLLTVTVRSTHRQRQHTTIVSPARSRTARGRAAGRASSPRRRRPTARRAPRRPGPPARRGPRRPRASRPPPRAPPPATRAS